MLIHHFIEKNAEIFPDKVAVICDDVRCTYAELNAMANNLAGWLLDHGLKSGDRVALLLNNSVEYVVSYYGILKAGGVVAPLGSDLKPDHLRILMQKLQATALITSARFERLIEADGCSALGIHRLLVVGTTRSWIDATFVAYSWDEVITGGTAANPVVPQEEGNLASIIFTSGSMGQPKGVMLSHANIVANTSSICHYLGLSAADRQMVVLPFHYVMGKSLLNTHMAVGGSVVINNRFAFPADVLQQMAREEVTGFSGVPSTYAYLMHRSPLRSYRDRLGSLRYCSQAGGHLSRQIKEELLDVLPPHTRLYVMYGATEAAARLSFVEPERLREKPDSIGRPIPGVTLRILDEHGRELPVGQVGELVAAGANIMQGYWQDAAATAAVLGVEGYRTGDLGYRDEDSYFFIVGRKDSQLKVGGHRVNSQEIEDALVSTGLVIEAAVIGLEDVLAGHRLAAIVVPIDMCTTERDILSRCSQLLPRYKLPGEIRFIRTLPKNSNGKLDRAGCVELFRNSIMASAASP